MRRLLLGLLLVAATAAHAHADDAEDGVYGRLSADLVLSAGAGGGVAWPRGGDARPSVLGELRVRYLDMAGLMVAFDGRPDGESMAILAADVRPLFLGRLLTGNAFERRFWDLLVDSIGLDLGVAFVPLSERVGVALAVGFGLDVPLVFFGRGAEGISLRLFARHVAGRVSDRAGPGELGVHDWLLGAVLTVRGQLVSGLPAWERRRYRTGSSGLGGHRDRP